MTPHIPSTRSRRGGRALPGTAAGGLARAARGTGRGVAVFVAALSAAGLTACSADQPAVEGTPAARTATASGSPAPGGSSTPPGQVSVLATGLEAPWGIAFLPDGGALVTERDTGPDPAGAGPAAAARPRSQQRARRGRRAARAACSASRSPRRTPGPDGLRLLLHRARTTGSPGCALGGGSPQPILTGIPQAGIHNGGRLAFGPDGMLYAGTGDAGDRGRPRTAQRSAARSCG